MRNKGPRERMFSRGFLRKKKYAAIMGTIRFMKENALCRMSIRVPLAAQIIRGFGPEQMKNPPESVPVARAVSGELASIGTAANGTVLDVFRLTCLSSTRRLPQNWRH